jgi:hypothetical protein
LIWGTTLGLALFVSGCKGSDDSPSDGGGEQTDSFSYCGDYRGPKPGTILNVGTRRDECDFDREGYADAAKGGDAQGANSLLSEATGNACHWRVVLVDDNRLLDEGDCKTAIANEAPGGLLLALGVSEGNPSGDQYLNFGFDLSGATLRISGMGKTEAVDDPMLWCDLDEGAALSRDDASLELSGPVWVTASYTHRVPAEDGQPSVANLGVITAFSCSGELGVGAASNDLKDAQVTIESVERKCWFTNSFVYQVSGSASLSCIGNVDGDLSNDVEARFEITF